MASCRARRRLALGLDLGLVPGQAQEDVVEARLAQGQAGDGHLGRIERAQDLGAHLGPVLDGQLDHVAVDDRRLARERGHQGGGPLRGRRCRPG